MYYLLYLLCVGLKLYASEDKFFYYDIAEAPLKLNQQGDCLKPLFGKIKITLNEETEVNHVRCHIVKGDSLKYSIEEEYEPGSCLIAVLLINSSDSLKLDSHQLMLAKTITDITIPIYIISSSEGAKILSHLETTDCYCSFDFSSTGNVEYQNRHLPSTFCSN